MLLADCLIGVAATNSLVSMIIYVSSTTFEYMQLLSGCRNFATYAAIIGEVIENVDANTS